MDLQDKHVVVTGASRGIGEALATRFARHGARVSLVARTKSALDSLAEQLRGQAFACDLSRKDQIAGLIARIEEKSGPIDVLVNNAGLDASKRLEDSTAEEVEQVLYVNLIAPAELCRQVLPGMLARERGHIVNISSLAGIVPFPGFATYGSSKAGLSHFTSCLQGDLTGTGVNTTLVELGPVPTEMYASVKQHPPTEAAFNRAKRLLLVREVSREEVADRVIVAVQMNERRVCLPTRGIPFTALTDLPRKIIQWLISDIPRR
jgi:uncharacterized protein